MKTIFTFILSIILIGASAQKLKVREEHGDVFKTKGYNIEDIYELSSGGYWSIGSRWEGSGLAGMMSFVTAKKVFFVQNFDEDMNFVGEKRLNLTFMDKDLDLHSIVRFKNEYYIFLQFDNIEKKKTYLFYALFDHHDLKIDGDLTKVAEIGLGSKATNSRPGSFDVSVSENENFLVVFGNAPTKIKKTKRRLFGGRGTSQSSVGTHTFKFTYWVLDKDFQIINYEKKHELKIENSSDKFYIRDYAVDEEGSIYILGKNSIVDELTRSEKRKRKSRAWVEINKSAFIVEKIDIDGLTFQQATPEEVLFRDMDILFDKDGQINLVGITGEQVYSRLVTTGVVRLVLDKDNLDVLSNVGSGFEEELLEKINDIQTRTASLNKRRKRRQKRREAKLSAEDKAYREISKRAALNANFIAYSGLDENGDAIIVLEEQHLEIVTTTTTDANGNTTTTTTYYYHYDDLIMAKFIDDEVVQNYYKKSFVSVNRPLSKSMDVALKDGEINIMTQGHIVKADYDLEKVRDYELKAFSRKDKVKGMRRKFFTYRKTIDENTILAAAQHRRKVVWYKIQVQ
jgi:hypothetical protein